MNNGYGIEKAVSNGQYWDCLHWAARSVISAVKSIYNGAAKFSEFLKEDVHERFHGSKWKKTMKDIKFDMGISMLNNLFKSYSMKLLLYWKTMSDDPSCLFKVDCVSSFFLNQLDSKKGWLMKGTFLE